MRTKIINHELGIGACSMADIPALVTAESPPENVTFFYDREHDLIVLNKEHPIFELIEKVVTAYLGISEAGRKAFIEQTKELNNMFKVLNRIIEYRQRKEVENHAKNIYVSGL